MKVILLVLIFCTLATAAPVSKRAFGRQTSLPNTGQFIHYSTAPQDDSNWQPAISSMSYTMYRVAGASVTVDNNTGLMWMVDPWNEGGLAAEYITWEAALDFCNTTSNAGAGFAGYTDWRLPNAKELWSIFDFGQPASGYGFNVNYFKSFTSFGEGYYDNYWTSTSYPDDPYRAYEIEFWPDYPALDYYYLKTSNYNDTARCVRGGPNAHTLGRKAGIPNTGSVVHYSTSPKDDSDYQPVAGKMRYQMFYRYGSSVTYDAQTGLWWPTDPNSTIAATLTDYLTWEQALSTCTYLVNQMGGTGLGGFTDWRLPNARELVSIIDYSKSGAGWDAMVDTDFFTGYWAGYYWTSTTALYQLRGLRVSLNVGGVYPIAKTDNEYSVITCVRGGAQ